MDGGQNVGVTLGGEKKLCQEKSWKFLTCRVKTQKTGDMEGKTSDNIEVMDDEREGKM